MVVRTTQRVVALVVLGFVLGIVWAAAAPAASAKSSTKTIRLGLTGMVTQTAPHGSWTMTVRPGQTLGFLAGLVPGLDHLDLDGVLGIRVSMNADRLPGGSDGKTLDTRSPYRLTVKKAGSYPVHWTVAFVLGHGRQSSVVSSRDFDATILVGPSTGQRSPGLVNPVVVSSHPSTQPTGAPATNRLTPVPASVVPSVPSATPTITLPPDVPGSQHPRPGAFAPLPQSAPADTYLFTAVVGTVVIGVLWLLWVASIKPILGR